MHAVMGTGRLIGGRYRLQGPIGRGAMGIVWRGRDELLHRDVAVKEVQISALAPASEAEAAYQRTLREARTAARLSHPGVVTIFDVVEEDASPWIVMELIDGRSLDQVIAEDGPLPPRLAAELGTSLLGALTTAHAAGVLHRDVKPGNVLVAADGRAVLTDFGIATFAGDPGLTQVGMVVGTPGFTAPERVRGDSATPASDLWSLGATLYAAVEGRGPFDRAGGATAIIAGVAAEDAPRAPSAGPLGPVIDALLRRDPDRRPDAASAAALLARASAETGAAGPAGVAPRAGRFGPAGPGSAGSVSGGHGPAGSGLAGLGAGRLGAGRLGAAGLGAAELGTAGLGAAELGTAAAGAAGLAAAGFAAGRLGADQSGPAGTAQLAAAHYDLPHNGDVQYAAQYDATQHGGAQHGGPGSGPGRPGAGLAGAAGQHLADSGLASNPDAATTALPVADQAGGAASFLDPPAYADLRMPGPRPGGPGARGEAGGPGTGLPGSLDEPGPWGAAGRRSAAAGPPGPAPRRQPWSRHWRIATVATGIAAIVVAAVLGTEIYSRTLSGGPASNQAAGGVHGAAAAGGASTGPSAGPAAPPGATGPAGASTGQAGQAGASSSPGTGSAVTGTPPPAGYHWQTVTAGTVGATAGFIMAVPDGWQLRLRGQDAYFEAPGGAAFIEVSMSRFSYHQPAREAHYQQATAIATHEFPGYVRGGIRAARFQEAAAATWRYSWKPAGGARTAVLSLLVTLPTSAGPQPYALTVSSPAASFGPARSAFGQALVTFRPLPPS